METINNFIYNIAKYPAILGDLILEEGQQINQHIKDNITDNITKLNILSLEYYEYIPKIITSAIISLFLIMLTWFIILYKNEKTNNSAKNSISIVSGTSLSIGAQLHINKPIIINKGLYIESVKELNAASKKIVRKFEKGQTYFVLIRVQMRDYITMAGTQYELHGNNIHVETTNTKEAFLTKDAYLILEFKILNDINQNSLVGNVITYFMNELNHGEYTTNDFIICAIGTSPNIDTLEFYNGLKHIGYELENNLQVYKKINRMNITSNYSLLLPIHQVYDLFMDVYNNCVFESTKYVIDNENYESWNNKPINDLVF